MSWITCKTTQFKYAHNSLKNEYIKKIFQQTHEYNFTFKIHNRYLDSHFNIKNKNAN